MTVPCGGDRTAYWRARDRLTYAMHELPAGVLDGAEGASADGCAEMLRGLEACEQSCGRLGLDDHRAFVDACRRRRVATRGRDVVAAWGSRHMGVASTRRRGARTARRSAGGPYEAA